MNNYHLWLLLLLLSGLLTVGPIYNRLHPTKIGREKGGVTYLDHDYGGHTIGWSLHQTYWGREHRHTENENKPNWQLNKLTRKLTRLKKTPLSIYIRPFVKRYIHYTLSITPWPTLQIQGRLRHMSALLPAEIPTRQHQRSLSSYTVSLYTVHMHM